MSNPDGDKSNPFIRPTACQASLFGSTTTAASNSSTLFGSASSGSISSLFGTSQGTIPSDTALVPSATLFGGISSPAVGTVPNISNPAQAGSSIFGGNGRVISTVSSSALPLKSSLFASTASVGAVGTSVPSLFGGFQGSSAFATSKNISSFNNHSSYVVDEIKSVSQVPVTKSEKSGKSLFGYCGEKQQVSNISSSLFLPGESKATSLFGGKYSTFVAKGDTSSFSATVEANKSTFAKPDDSFQLFSGINAKSSLSSTRDTVSPQESYHSTFHQYPESTNEISNDDKKISHSQVLIVQPEVGVTMPLTKLVGSSGSVSTCDMQSSPADNSPHTEKGERKKSPSLMDKIEPTAIIATDIPDAYLDKSILKFHFAKFGTVMRIILRKEANQAQVNFVSHESAALAKRRGKSLHPNVPDMMIFFAAAARSRHEDNQDSQARQRKNNAVKLLRQSSSESREKHRQRARKPSQDFSTKVVVHASEDVSKHKYVARARHLPSLEEIIAKEKFSSRASSPASQATTAAIQDTSQSKTQPFTKDFSTLATTKATSSQDRYTILDGRDKLMRKQQTKVVDVKKAKYLAAMCPDMCPEKERYMREAQNDLSPYEIISDHKVDHSRAVKKFSRSSADKDEPLPHELRSGPVLVKTINYLLCNIIQEMEDGSNADLDLCYNYLWDRTRAMRSDIMQQHLQDECAVYVLERCVRFHIFCSERLCLESADIFDPKMNAEHLSKSMHSLKELYQDLTLNGVYFQTEAEFRCYEILLNVNDGNIMFVYLLFRDSVRTSKEVQFAIKVFHAVQSNHYVHFFRLAKEATYLQACIMHRYFNHIRSKALNILVKALHVPGKSQSMSLQRLVKLLLFKDSEEAMNYIAIHGLTVGDSGRVVIVRDNFIAHPTECPPRRSFIVAAKKFMSVAEEINGGSLPPNPLLSHKVHNSFTSAGYLNSEALNAKDQVRNYCMQSELVSHERTEGKVTLTADITQSGQNSGNLEMPIECESYETDNNEPYSEKDDRYDECEGYEDEQLVSEEVEENVADDELELEEEWKDFYDVAVEEFNQKLEYNTLKKYFNLWRSQVEVPLALQSIVLHLKQKSQLNVGDEMKSQSVADYARELFSMRLREKCFRAWCQLCIRSRRLRSIKRSVLSRRVLHQWRSFVSYKKQQHQLKEIRSVVADNLSTIRIRYFVRKWCWGVRYYKFMRSKKMQREQALKFKYYNLWRKFVKEKEWQKKKMHEGFPACASRLSVKEQNRILNFRCSNIKRSFQDLYKFEENIKKKRDTIEIVRCLSESICHAPLPVRSAFERFINSTNVPVSMKTTFFTLVILFESNIDKYVANWLRMKLNPSEKAESVHINCSYNIKSSLTGKNHVIQIMELKNEHIQHIKGISGILYVTAKEQRPEQASAPSSSSLLLNTKTFLLNRKLCCIPNTSPAILNEMIALYKSSYPLFSLQSCSLQQLVTSFVSHHVLDVARNTARMSGELYLAPLPPSAYCMLLERAVQHLHSALTSAKVAGVQWQSAASTPATPVICCMHDSVVRTAVEALHACLLPPCIVQDWHTWAEALNDVLEYVMTVAKDDAACYGLMEEISWQVDQSRQDLIKLMIVSTEEDNLPSSLLLPWRNIISTLIVHKLSKVASVDVIYCVEELENYKCGNDWYLPYMQPLDSVPSLLPSYKRKALAMTSQLSVITKKARPDSDFLNILVEEKKENEAFEARLQRLLDDSDEGWVDLFSDESSAKKETNLDSDDLYDMTEPTLLTKIAREKEKFLAFENKLKQMLDDKLP